MTVLAVDFDKFNTIFDFEIIFGNSAYGTKLVSSPRTSSEIPSLLIKSKKFFTILINQTKKTIRRFPFLNYDS